MTSSQDQLVQNIQSALAASPELQKQLAAAQSKDQAADLLSKALGSPVTAADLQGLSDKVQSHMTDEQLETVAAGMNNRTDWILISIFSLGSACAAASIDLAINDPKAGCKSLFSNQ